MKKLIVVGIVVCLLAAGLLASASGISAAPDKGFTGAWWSIDSDGSNQRLVIGGGGNGVYRIYYHDDGATGCCQGCDPNPMYPGFGLGTATGSGNELAGELSFWCLSQPRTLLAEGIAFPVYYDPVADTVAMWGVTWYRMGTGP